MKLSVMLFGIVKWNHVSVASLTCLLLSPVVFFIGVFVGSHWHIMSHGDQSIGSREGEIAKRISIISGNFTVEQFDPTPSINFILTTREVEQLAELTKKFEVNNRAPSLKILGALTVSYSNGVSRRYYVGSTWTDLIWDNKPYKSDLRFLRNRIRKTLEASQWFFREVDFAP